MAQRIRGCTNSTNFETINCDAYLPKLLKRDKPVVMNRPGSVKKCFRDSSPANAGASAAVATPTNLKSRPGAVRQQNLQPVRTPPSSANSIQKEPHSNKCPVVEVTVRTQGNGRACTGDSKANSRQPWGKLLNTANSSENLSSFSSFDPLRTLHFLAKELKSKVKVVAPNDINMLQMVSDMQQALKRVPHEIASSIHLNNEQESLPLKRSSSEIRCNSGNDSHQMQLPATKPFMDHKSCQTINRVSMVTESEIFQNKLEENAEKLESAYASMEKLCSQLRNEKEEVELLLLAEKDTVKFLRKQIEELETIKSEARTIDFEKFAEERDNMQSQIKRLKTKIDNQGGSSSRELRSALQELHKEKAEIEEENLSLRHKLAFCSTEKDKYIAILKVRDRQINEIRSEMNQLQEVITEQLTELQRSSFASSPSQSAALGVYM